ncbi:MAG: hypothetical protein ABI334_00225 [Candidatus Dormiibacterota bacterium]
MHDGEQRDRAWNRWRRGARRRLLRLELAPFGRVDDLPPTLTQLLAQGIGGGEVVLPPALDALGEQLLRLVSV